eukprot:TRINITY_DN28870_c0_g1_i1.p1 TRINITY_DN28870_c0_g1~~TRINITY_DN28870_c0_g1_i1.p1  ORF type:complete len:521 (-),score=105.98 TRINITY_DN28870_c0_g1_i1:138-1700(-)
MGKQREVPSQVYVVLSAVVVLFSYSYARLGFFTTLFLSPLPLVWTYKFVVDSVGSSDVTRMSLTSSLMALGVFPSKYGVPEPIMHAILWMHELPEMQEVHKLFSEICDTPAYFRLKSTCSRRSNGDAQWNLIPHQYFNIQERFILSEVSSEEEIRLYAEKLVLIEMNSTKPLWEIHVLKNVGNGRSAMIPKFHHSIGDGISMVGLFLNTFKNEDGSKVELPGVKNLDGPPRSPGAPKPDERSNRKPWWQVFLQMLPTTVATVVMYPYVKPDSPLCTQDPTGPKNFSGNRNLVICHPIELSLVKEIKQKLGVTVNDVCVSAITGAIRRYCESQNDPALDRKDLYCRALFPYGFPRPLNPSKLKNALRNLWVVVSMNLPIEFPSSQPVERLKATKKNADRLKASMEPFVVLGFQIFIRTFLPFQDVQQINFDTAIRRSLLFTNVPGPDRRVLLAGKPVDHVDPFFVGPVPHLAAMSYNGKVSVTWFIDPQFVTDSDKLAKCFKEELLALRASIAGASEDIKQ